MSDSKEFYFYFSTSDCRVFFNYILFHGRQMREFRLALPHHQDGKISGVNRRIADAREYQRYASDVVQVAVGYDERLYFVFPFFKVSRVGYDIVHSGCGFVGKMHTGINNNDVFADFYGGHILADFFHSSEWNDADYAGSRRGNISVFPATGIFILVLRAKRS